MMGKSDPVKTAATQRANEELLDGFSTVEFIMRVALVTIADPLFR